MKAGTNTQGGFTLVEIAVAIGLMLSGLAIVLAVGASMSRSNTGTLTLQQIQMIERGVVERYASRSNYAGLSTASAIDEGIIPEGVVVTNALGVKLVRLANGRPVALSPASYVGPGVSQANASFLLSVAGLSPAHCRTIVSAIAPTMLQVVVLRAGGGSTVVVDDRGQTPASSLVASACTDPRFLTVNAVTI
jgi:type II secretory pathway pseudopilin PulG